MKRTYETIIIYDTSLDESSIDQKIQKVETVIKNNNGEIAKLEKWGKKTLAYLIEKKREGFYVFILHSSEPTVVEQLRNLFHFDETIMKHMTIVVEEIKKSRFAPKKAKAAKAEAAPEETAAGEAVTETEVNTEETPVNSESAAEENPAAEETSNNG
jgi:small subunit ribosomal protein S6